MRFWRDKEKYLVHKVNEEEKAYLDKVYSQPNSMPLCKSELPGEWKYERHCLD